MEEREERGEEHLEAEELFMCEGVVVERPRLLPRPRPLTALTNRDNCPELNGLSFSELFYSPSPSVSRERVLERNRDLLDAAINLQSLFSCSCY